MRDEDHERNKDTLARMVSAHGAWNGHAGINRGRCTIPSVCLARLLPSIVPDRSIPCCSRKSEHVQLRR